MPEATEFCRCSIVERMELQRDTAVFPEVIERAGA